MPAMQAICVMLTADLAPSRTKLLLLTQRRALQKQRLLVNCGPLTAQNVL